MTEKAEQLIQRLRAYGRQLAPHVKQREGGQLIVEATEALAAAVQCAEELKERLSWCRFQCHQRGQRMQVMREAFREIDWDHACRENPEMRDWFDTDGRPR